MKSLLEVFEENGCEKIPHEYHRVYGKDFESLRNEEINILEIGVFQGKSLRCWLDYFPNAKIYGIDTFERYAMSHDRFEDLRNNPRVVLKEADSRSESSVFEDVQFDIIIDDGLHTPEANRLTFDKHIATLKDGGVYYIEDLLPIDFLSDEEIAHAIRKYLPYTESTQNREQYRRLINTISNYNFIQYDLRPHSNLVNSFLIKIMK